LEAFEDVVSVNKSLGPTKDCIIEVKGVLLGLNAKLSFIKLNVKFFKNERDELGRFVADFSQAKRNLRKMLRGKELRGLEAVL